MRDGAVEVAFRPKLTAEQYTELLDTVKESATKDEFRQLMTGLAIRWEIEANCDETALKELACD